MQPAPAQAKIELREFNSADWPLVWHWIRPYLGRLLHDHGPHTERDFVDSHLERGSRTLGVYRQGELVGVFICDHVSSVLTEAHCYFKRSFWGRENTLPALRLGVAWAFNHGYEKIGAYLMENNRLMIKLLERVGAVQEARFIGHARQNGRPINMVYYSIFKGG